MLISWFKAFVSRETKREIDALKHRVFILEDLLADFPAPYQGESITGWVSRQRKYADNLRFHLQRDVSRGTMEVANWNRMISEAEREHDEATRAERLRETPEYVRGAASSPRRRDEQD